MGIAADHGAVQTHLAHIVGGHGGQLGGEEVLFGDAVHVVKDAHHSVLHPVLALVGIGGAADENIQTLAGDALGHGLFHLVGRQMGQQVGDDKLGVARLTADNHIHHFPALQGHNAVELQGDGDPLVLLDAAVVMGLEKAHLVRLIHGDLL